MYTIVHNPTRVYVSTYNLRIGCFRKQNFVLCFRIVFLFYKCIIYKINNYISPFPLKCCNCKIEEKHECVYLMLLNSISK